MSHFTTPTSTDAATYVTGPFHNSPTRWLLTRWLLAGLLAAAIWIHGTQAILADTQVDTPGLASVEAGIAAAKAGRMKDAIVILAPHAQNGHLNANYALGLIHMYDRGGMTPNPRLSHIHFRRAAAGGHVNAIFEMAFQLERGIGTKADMTKAIRFYSIAAGTNHLNAQYNLAILLSRPDAAPPDLKRAYFWAIAARHNAIRTSDPSLTEERVDIVVRTIRARIPHQVAAQAYHAAARLTGQPI